MISLTPGPAALTTRDVSLAGATIGVIMGGLMTMGLGLRLFMNPELLGPELRELSKSGMNSGLALTLCMVCMLVVVQFTYALLAMIAARWTLAKLSDPS